MRSQQRKSTALILITWILFFIAGLIAVFLFLDGKWVIQDGKFVSEQSGYVDFSSPKAALYADGKFIVKQWGNISFRLQKYDFCIERFYFQSRCFAEVEVQKNAKKRINLEGIYLYPSDAYPQKITNAQVLWEPNGKGLVWHDEGNKMIYFLDKKTEEIRGYYPNIDLKKIEWSEKEEVFFLISDEGKRERFSPFSLDLFNSFAFSSQNSEIEYGKQNIFYVIGKKNEKEIIATFSEPFEAVIPLEDLDARLLVFPSSVYLFFEQHKSIQKLLKKEEGSSVIFLPKKNQIFWQEKGVLWKKQL